MPIRHCNTCHCNEQQPGHGPQAVNPLSRNPAVNTSTTSTHGQAPAPNPIANEFTQMFNGIQEYFRALYTPPQIRVSRSGFWYNQSMAFGRGSLGKLSYDEAQGMFREIFENGEERSNNQNQNDKQPGGGGDGSGIGSRMEIHATFLREPKGGVEGSVVLHKSAWPEVLENVKALQVVFKKE